MQNLCRNPFVPSQVSKLRSLANLKEYMIIKIYAHVYVSFANYDRVSIHQTQYNALTAQLMF